MGLFPVSTNVGQVNFSLFQEGGYEVLRSMFYPDINGEAAAFIPYDIMGWLYRYRLNAQGTTDLTTAFMNASGTTGAPTVVATVATPIRDHLTIALSTNRGAMPRVLRTAGMLAYGAGGAGDESGTFDLFFKREIDLDESFGAGVCRLEYRQHTWVSNAAGAGSIKLDDLEHPSLPGLLVAVDTLPDAFAVPTTLYDIVIADEMGIDVADALLLNRSATNPEQVYLWHTAAIATRHQKALGGRPLYVNITNAGNAKAGMIGFYLAVPVDGSV